MSGHRSTIKGAASFRRLLKQLPDSADQQILAMLNDAAPVLAAQMKARTPSRTGGLRGAISAKVTPGTKTLKVGLLNTRLGRSKFFYGHILDVGRKAGVYAVKRGPKAGSKVRLPAYAPLRLVYQGLQDFRRQFLPDYHKLMDGILLKAAQGGGDD